MFQASAGLVSVIMPAFNASASLAETIESCLAQTYRDFELLVVDDGSTDQTASIAKRYAAGDPRVRVFQVANRGMSAARNLAIEHGRGSFFALLDSDDIWMTDYLERQLAILHDNRGFDVVTANAINVGSHLDGQPYWSASPMVRPLTLLEMIAREDAVHIFSVFRRSVIDRVHGFNEKFRGNEDYDLWLRAAASGCRFIADFTPRGYYRRRPDSVSSDQRRMLVGIIGVLEGIRPYCPVGGPEAAAIDAQVRRFTRELCVAEARASIATGKASAAVEHLTRIPRAQRGHALSALVMIAAVWPSALSYGYRLKGWVRETCGRFVHTGARARAAR